MRRLAAVVIAVVAAALLYFTVYVPYRFNVVKKSSLRLLTAAVRSGNTMAAARAAQNTLSDFRAFETTSAYDVELWVGKALAFTALERHADAADALEQALAIDERPEIYLKLAAAREALSDREGAIEAYARAAAFNRHLSAGIPDRTLRRTVRRRAWQIRKAGEGDP